MAGLWLDDDAQEINGGILGRLGGRIPYLVTAPVVASLIQGGPSIRVRATDYILEHYDGNDPVLIDLPVMSKIVARPPRRFQSRIDNLLSDLARMVDHSVSNRVEIRSDATDRTTNDLCRSTFSTNARELDGLIRYTDSKGWTRCPDSSTLMRKRVWVTGDGLTYLDQQAASAPSSKLAFVAMWFDDSTTLAYTDGIRPAIMANGFDPIRIDQKEHSGKIDDEIILDIRRSRFVVADFSCGASGARGGVYFEAGFAFALEKPVIWTVREDDLARVHFDTRQFNHIVWHDPDDLRTRLQRRIGAVIGPAH